jgi:hypothetical protein
MKRYSNIDGQMQETEQGVWITYADHLKALTEIPDRSLERLLYHSLQILPCKCRDGKECPRCKGIRQYEQRHPNDRLDRKSA